MRKYNQAPLPFQGQKRRFVKHFTQALQDYPSDATYIDLFGGSGLLSHTVKTVHPTAKVVYNDFDDYSKRLKAIDYTNTILEDLRAVLHNYPRGKRIFNPRKDKVISVLRNAEKYGYVDYITLSSSLKFSMNYGTCLQDFAGDTLYNTVRKNNYERATDYLQGVEIVKCDYKVLFEKYKDFGDVIFLVDPPYLSTDSATYSSDGYWKLRDYLDVLQVLVEQNYFYFTSDKSQIVELCEWVSSVSVAANPFANATKAEVNTSMNFNSKYTDIMYHYKKGD